MPDIHPRFSVFAVALNHAQKIPAITLVKTGVVCYKIKCADSSLFHIGGGFFKKRAGNSIFAVIFLRVDSAYIRRKIRTVMKVVFDDTASADNLSVFFRCIPLRNG